MENGRKKTTYTWNARKANECIRDLVTLCQELRVGLTSRFDKIVPIPVKKLGKVFDLEHIVEHLCKFKVANGKLVISRQDRIEWEADGSSEFSEFHQHVCAMPHVLALADEDHGLDLLPHDSLTILKNFKTTLKKIFWESMGNCTDTMFADHEGKSILEFKQSNLTALSAIDEDSLDKWFELRFTSGAVVKARLCEDHVIAAFYNNECIYGSLGKELCIALDIALAAGGCEAVVEGFYSVIGAHKKNGGQSNDVLVKRAIVDWSLPNPLSCPKTMQEIGRLYTEGDKKLGIAKHRLPIFSDSKGRAAMKYDISKVVDRLSTELPKCPHVIKADIQ